MTLQLSTSLGNFVAQYGGVDEGSPLRTICSLKPGTKGSLIEVEFRCGSAGGHGGLGWRR